MSRRLGQVRRKGAECAGVSFAKRVDGVEFDLVEGQAACEPGRVKIPQVVLGFENSERVGKGCRHVLRWPVSHNKSLAFLGHHADSLAEFACPLVDIAEDAAMGFLEAARVERACEPGYLSGSGLRFELGQRLLVADVFPIDENIRTRIAVRVVQERAHATAEALGR